MTGAFIVALITVIVGIVVYLFELRWRKRHPEAKTDIPLDGLNQQSADTNSEKDSTQESSNGQESSGESTDSQGECCGMHLVCEKDTLSPVTTEVEYYDDEELDRFIGREAGSYTPEEEEEFRDVLMTLRQEDVPGWARSVTQRGLNLPSEVREELLLLVREARAAKTK